MFERFHSRFVEPVYHAIFIGYIFFTYTSPTLVSVILFAATYFAVPFIDEHLANIAVRTGIALGVGIVSLLILRRSSTYRNSIRRIAGLVARALQLHLEEYKVAIEPFSQIPHYKLNKQQKAYVSALSRKHAVELCTLLSEAFRIQTQRPCHACLKSLIEDMVITRARDAISDNWERKQIDEALNFYPYARNTAFQQILDDNSCHMFHSNHLRLMAWFSRYDNANGNWRKYYRATVVIPVTLSTSPESINRATVLGFLCIDSRRANFDRRDSLALLNVFAPLFYDIMVTLDRVDDAPMQEPAQ